MKKIALLLLAVICIPALWSCRGPEGPQVCFQTAGGTACLSVELAVTPDERALGLMYRHALDPGHGMLFVFASDADHTFTMRNTYLPLSMIFIDAGNTVAGCIDDAAPMTPGPYAIGSASRYVVETHASFCRREGLAPGDRAEFINLPPLRQTR